MFAVKLLANLAIVTLFWRCLNTFSHFTFHMSLEVSYYNWSLLKAVHVFYVNVQFKRTNQGCSPSKLANQSMLNGALVIKMVKKNFGLLTKRETF